jgi:hypothetical protein
LDDPGGHAVVLPLVLHQGQSADQYCSLDQKAWKCSHPAIEG